MVLVPMIASGAPLPVPGPALAEVKILSNYTDICNICNDFVPITIYNVTLHLYYLSVSVISGLHWPGRRRCSELLLPAEPESARVPGEDRRPATHLRQLWRG